MTVAGHDEIGGGLKRAFQDAVIRNVLKDHDPDRRLHDCRNASDKLEGSRNDFFTLMNLVRKIRAVSVRIGIDAKSVICLR